MLLRLCLALLLCAQAAAQSLPAPGKTFTITCPELGDCAHKGPARCEVYLPKDYQPDRSFPLLVWFGGGYGGHQVGQAKSLTGGQGYICVALPYRHHEDPRGGMWGKSPWDGWYRNLLDKVAERVPNIHPEKRVAAGFSSGGTAVCSLIGRQADGPRQYFNAWMPGGAGWAMGGMEKIKGHPMLIFIGDGDDRRNNLESLHKEAQAAGVQASLLLFKNTGHSIPKSYHQQMRDWMRQHVLHRRLPEAVRAYQQACSKKNWPAAWRGIQLVHDWSDANSPERQLLKEHRPSIDAAAQEAFAKLKAKAKAEDIHALAAQWTEHPLRTQMQAEANRLATQELQELIADESRRGTSKLLAFANFWQGYPCGKQAIDIADKRARSTLASIDSEQRPERLAKELQVFIEDWAICPSADQARAQLEQLASTELAAIRALPQRQHSSKLRRFAKTYAGTKVVAALIAELQAKRDAEHK